MQNCDECQLNEATTPSILHCHIGSNNTDYDQTLYFCAKHVPKEIREWIGGHAWKKITTEQNTMSHKTLARDSEPDPDNPESLENPV